jgi:hypothetical protein
MGGYLRDSERKGRIAMTHVRDNARLYFFGALGGLLFGDDTGVI